MASAGQLLQCSCGRWSAFAQSLFCAACAAVKCQHPTCTGEVVELGYCAGCGRMYSSHDLSREPPFCTHCKCCGKCGAALPKPRDDVQLACTFCATPALPATATAADRVAMDLGAAMQASRHARHRLLGEPAPAGGTAPRHTHRTYDDEGAAFGVLRSAQAKLSSGVEPALSRTPVEHAFAELEDECWATPPCGGDGEEEEEEEEEQGDTGEGESHAGSLPSPARLIPLLQRKCLSCVSLDLPGVLMSPNAAPFASLGPAAAGGGGGGGGRQPGPAGLTWGKAKWYRKECSARTLLPCVELLDGEGRVTTLAQLLLGGGGEGELVSCQFRFTNPSDQRVVLHLHDGVGVETGSLVALPGADLWLAHEVAGSGGRCTLLPHDPYGLQGEGEEFRHAVGEGADGLTLRGDGAGQHVAAVRCGLVRVGAGGGAVEGKSGARVARLLLCARVGFGDGHDDGACAALNVLWSTG